MLPVADQAAAGRCGCELADIFRDYGEEYRRTHRLALSHLRVMRAVERCRTAALGGHMQQCDTCGFERPAYNSCRNRHCPKCQSMAKARWLEKQKSELLPVDYFHLVFTLPHELNGLILANKRALLNLLFQTVSETLLEFARTHLRGTPGFICVLHTWDQTLLDHFHLHCLFPAGALSSDQNRWIPARRNFLFHVKALSIVFRGKFLHFLKKAFNQQKLLFPGQTAPLADAGSFKLLLKALRQKPWVVYAKKPFASPNHVLDYLGRYTHRVALSNDRILSARNGEVTFTYRDRKNQNQLKLMKLKTEEFIRHFGFLANRSKGLLSKCRKLLDLNPALPKLPQRSTHELMLALTGIDLTRCPLCQRGTLVFLAKLLPAPWDSS